MREGDTAIFCVELAVPEGPVRWLRNQQEVVAGGRVAITAEGTCHTLTIFQCSLEDMGEVVFLAGDSRTSTQFCVSGKAWRDTCSPGPLPRSCARGHQQPLILEQGWGGEGVCVKLLLPGGAFWASAPHRWGVGVLSPQLP